MTADRNFSIKLTLGDANRVRKALEAQKDSLANFASMSPTDDAETRKQKHEAGGEAMELERILRISF
jgi:hypothetical protein